MKKFLLVILSLVMLMAVGCAKTETTPVVESKTIVEDALENPQAYRSLDLGAFSTNAESAPTDDELRQMFDFAMNSRSGHGLTPAHFVVVRDLSAQQEMMGYLSNIGLQSPVSEGTVTVLVLADTLRNENIHEADYNGWYSQMYYGLYDAGAAAAYVTLAAQQMGFGVHQIAALNIVNKNLGEVMIGTGGMFNFITDYNWDVDVYMSDKDGTVDFTHHVAQFSPTGDHADVLAYGNLTLISTMVIGTKDESVDARASVTTAYDDGFANYNFWDPQDGTSYGACVPYTEKADPVILPGTDAQSGATSSGDAAANNG